MRLLRVIATVNPKGGGPMEGIRQITPLLSDMGHATEILSVDAPDDPLGSRLPDPGSCAGAGANRLLLRGGHDSLAAPKCLPF